MSAAQELSNKAIVARFEEAVSRGDWETISQTIDELVAPAALICARSRPTRQERKS